MTLDGCLVLIVEDEPIVAFALEDMILDAGGSAVSAERVDQATALIEAHRLDLAILDVNVHSHTSYPIAAALEKIGVPFIFATGYGDTIHPPEFKAIPTVTKPYSLADINEALASLPVPE
jgi:DNA-binding NtrC family response regulator